MSSGSIVHGGKRSDAYASKGFGPGDIVGCFIHLDEFIPENNHIRFFVNGVDLGVAFDNKKEVTIPSAVYYPALSFYKRVFLFPIH